MILRIFNLYVPLRKIFFFLLESFFIWEMVLLGTYLRFWGSETNLLDAEYLIYKSLIIVAAVQISLYYFDLYDLKIFRNNLELIIRLLQSLGVASIILATLYYLLPQLIIGRGIFFISLGFMALAIIIWRILYNYLVRKRQMNQKALIIGTGPLAKSIAQTILDRVDTGFTVIGFISDDPEKVGTPLVNPSIIGDYSQIIDLIKREKPDRIIVALEERRGKFPLNQLLECKMKGISIEDGINFYEHLTGRLQIESLRPSSLIFSEGFRKDKATLLLKRITGFLLSLVALTLLSPVIVLCSLLIKLDSKGPVFYRQERAGKNGKIFRLLKFRSMVENAEENGAVWACEKDDRVTRVGKRLRKYRLDEIPQMINVLKGDMSFVGPRPERPCFVEQLKVDIPYYDQRHTVTPGITGWAQIKYPYGATKEDALEKLKYDLYYIKNLSSLFDLMIIFETIKVVLFGKGAR
jgi:sugar transferase (PEP-CTERM system associated)